MTHDMNIPLCQCTKTGWIEQRHRAIAKDNTTIESDMDPDGLGVPLACVEVAGLNTAASVVVDKGATEGQRANR